MSGRRFWAMIVCLVAAASAAIVYLAPDLESLTPYRKLTVGGMATVCFIAVLVAIVCRLQLKKQQAHNRRLHNAVGQLPAALFTILCSQYIGKQRSWDIDDASARDFIDLYVDAWHDIRVLCDSGTDDVVTLAQKNKLAGIFIRDFTKMTAEEQDFCNNVLRGAVHP